MSASGGTIRGGCKVCDTRFVGIAAASTVCELGRLDGSSPQQAARECILRHAGVRHWLAGLVELEAEELERWQAGQHVVQACRLKSHIYESELQACEATQVTDASLRGNERSWVARCVLGRTPVCRSGFKQALWQTHACALDTPALQRQAALRSLVHLPSAAVAAAAGLLRASLPPVQMSC
jgi:hypothetical protein